MAKQIALDELKPQVLAAGFDFDIDIDFDSYDDDLDRDLSLPFCQALNPPQGKGVEEIIEDNLVFGIVIPVEQADAAGFVPDRRWTRETLRLSSKPGTPKTDCFLCRDEFRAVIIHRSGREIQFNAGKGFRFVDLAWRDGKPTQANQDYEQSKKSDGADSNWRATNRTLILFVDDNNKPLSDTPFNWSCKGGINASLGDEMTEVYRAFDAAFISSAKKKGQAKSKRPGYKMHASVVISGKLGPAKFGSNNAFMVLTEVNVPTDNPEAKPYTVSRGNKEKKELRPVVLNPTNWKRLFLLGETAERVNEFYETFADFGKPNRGRDAEPSDQDPAMPHSFFGIGEIIDAPKSDGDVVGFLFEWETGGVVRKQWCEVTGELGTQVLEQWTASNIKINGVFGLEGQWNDGKPVVAVESIEFDAQTLAPALDDADVF